MARQNGAAEIVQPIEIRGEKLGEVSLEGVQLVDEKSMELSCYHNRNGSPNTLKVCGSPPKLAQL